MNTGYFSADLSAAHDVEVIGFLNHSTVNGLGERQPAAARVKAVAGIKQCGTTEFIDKGTVGCIFKYFVLFAKAAIGAFIKRHIKGFTVTQLKFAQQQIKFV